jgi:hypothetical protein
LSLLARAPFFDIPYRYFESCRRPLPLLVVHLFNVAALIFVTSILDFFLQLSYGSDITCRSIVEYHLHHNDNFSSMVSLFYVAAAISDVGETVSAYPWSLGLLLKHSNKLLLAILTQTIPGPAAAPYSLVL